MDQDYIERQSEIHYAESQAWYNSDKDFCLQAHRPQKPQLDEFGCDVWYLGHILPDDDEAGMWCETHKIKFALGGTCPQRGQPQKTQGAA